MNLKKKMIACLSGLAGVLVAMSAHADDLGPIARNADGSVRTMTQRDAISYCSTRGGLPNIKQLALALNPNGVSDTRRDEYSKVAPQNEPQFYYFDGSYNRPSGDDGLFFFWSSSLYAGTLSSAYGFDGTKGYIGVSSRGTSNAVRCAGW
jgi:hypothetical protein